jgi:hypothetical protein
MYNVNNRTQLINDLNNMHNKINYVESSSKYKNVRDMYWSTTEFKKCYLPRSKFVNESRTIFSRILIQL